MHFFKILATLRHRSSTIFFLTRSYTTTTTSRLALSLSLSLFLFHSSPFCLSLTDFLLPFLPSSSSSSSSRNTRKRRTRADASSYLNPEREQCPGCLMRTSTPTQLGHPTTHLPSSSVSSSSSPSSYSPYVHLLGVNQRLYNAKNTFVRASTFSLSKRLFSLCLRLSHTPRIPHATPLTGEPPRFSRTFATHARHFRLSVSIACTG